MDSLPLSDTALIVERERREKDRPPREPNTFYVYDLAANECTLDTVLSIILGTEIGEEDINEDDLTSLRNFDAGNTLQTWWRNKLVSLGYKIISEEFRARWNPPDRQWVTHGRGDLLVQDPGYGPIRCREIKTIKAVTYVKSEPKKDHYLQDQYYINVLGLEYGTVDYIDKINFATGDNPVVVIHEFNRDRSVMSTLTQTGDELFLWCAPLWELMKSMNPLIPEDLLNLLAAKEIRLPYKSPCWKCDQNNRQKKVYCQHYELCDKISKIQASLEYQNP